MSSHPLPRVPADIIHCVFIQAQYHDTWDTQQLGTCSLVCKAWHDLARPLLFSHISVKSRADGARFFQFFDFVRSHPSLSKYIKRLSLKTRPWLAQRYETQGEQEADDQIGGLPPFYGNDIAMLDLAAFMSALPFMPGLRALWLMDVAIHFHEGNELEPIELELEELRVHGTHCSPTLLRTLHIFPWQAEADQNLDTPDSGTRRSLPVMRVQELTLSTPPHSPHVLTFYKLVLDHQALRSLSVKAEEAENVEDICEFLLPTFNGGLRNFTLDLHSYFNPIGALAPIDWEDVGQAVSLCTRLEYVELIIPAWATMNGRPGECTFLSLDDLTLFLRAVLPKLPRLKLRLMRAYEDLRPLSSQMVDEFLQDLTTLDNICSELYQGSARTERLVVTVQPALLRPRYQFAGSQMNATRVQEAMPKLRAAGVLRTVVAD